MKYAIGLMSGTSFDGLDVALVKIDGVNEQTKLALVHFNTYSYTPAYRQKLMDACKGQMTIREYCSFNFEIAQLSAKFILQFLVEHKLKASDISFIGSHGQTIYHLVDPKNGEIKSSLQFGDGSVIANLTGITTVSDFRVADMANGGQGAPIVCYPEYVLYRNLHDHVILQNIGGISNATVLHQKLDQVFAFDNGPGNVMIDYVCKHFFNLAYDKDGLLAKQGKLIKPLIEELSQDAYYLQVPPKTTGREKYHEAFILTWLNKYKQYDKYDLLYSATYFTAKIIIDSYVKFIMLDKNAKYLGIVSGGGASNPVLMQILKDLAPANLTIKAGWDYNINTDAKEAIAMVVLANQTLHQQPSNAPHATGASKPTILGKIAHANTGEK